MENLHARTVSELHGLTRQSEGEIGITLDQDDEKVAVQVKDRGDKFMTELCEKTRSEAFDLMIAHAQEIGANAVVGIRYDATEVMQGVTEVLCYGTAVVVEPGGA